MRLFTQYKQQQRRWNVCHRFFIRTESKNNKFQCRATRSSVIVTGGEKGPHRGEQDKQTKNNFYSNKKQP